MQTVGDDFSLLDRLSRLDDGRNNYSVLIHTLNFHYKPVVLLPLYNQFFGVIIKRRELNVQKLKMQ